MIAKDWGRTIGRISMALAIAGALGGRAARAQQPKSTRVPAGQAQPARPDQGKPASSKPVEVPALVDTRLPANPNDAIAEVNGEAISRMQLADECVARKGQEILETLIARKLIDQAIRAKKLEVTGAEINEEIDRVVATMAPSGVGREAWLRSLEKERGISPVQYARDIIYPTLALKKLAASQVQVTPQDMKDAFEAHFGEKLRCRIIMTDRLNTAQEIWNELKKNPGGFAKVAQERSIDATSKSLGGLVGEPITRHAYPRNVSDGAFEQLVDGDPNDKDPAHKPKDGDISGPIQVTESSWVIIKREGLVPAQPVKPDDLEAKKMLQDMMFEAKLKQKMGEVYQDLFRAAAIENKLTGQTKLANEEKHPDHQVDGNVKLMSTAGGTPTPVTPAAAPAGGTPKLQTPPGLSPDAAKKAEEFKRPLQTKP